MPPRSRGRRGDTSDAIARANGRHAASNAHHEQQQRRQGACNEKLRMQDPLTLFVTLVTYPLLVVALGVLHVIYDVVLKARASLRFQRAVVLQLQDDKRGPFLRQITGKRGRMSIEDACNDCARARLASLSVLQQKCLPGEAALKAVLNAKHGFLPRHVALALGAKPVRTSVLLARLLLLPIRHLSQPTDEGTKEARRWSQDLDQECYALLNMRSIVHNCAIAGIGEVTVFDEGGHLASAFRGSHQEVMTEQIVLDTAKDVMSKAEEQADDGVGSTVKIHIETTIHIPFRSAHSSGFNGNQPDCQGDGKGDGVVVRRIRVNVLGPEDAQGALARAATLLVQERQHLADHSKNATGRITDETVRDVLRAQDYPSDPDLLLVHGGARQLSTLHGFPPWLARLCEIHHDVDSSPYTPLTALSFERALQAYTRAEQRYGK